MVPARDINILRTGWGTERVPDPGRRWWGLPDGNFGVHSAQGHSNLQWPGRRRDEVINALIWLSFCLLIIFWCFPLAEHNWQLMGKRTWCSPPGTVSWGTECVKDWRMTCTWHSCLFRPFMFSLNSSLPVLFVVPWMHCACGRDHQKGNSGRESIDYEQESAWGLVK